MLFALDLDCQPKGEPTRAWEDGVAACAFRWPLIGRYLRFGAGRGCSSVGTASVRHTSVAGPTTPRPVFFFFSSRADFQCILS